VNGSHVKQHLIRDCSVVCMADLRQIEHVWQFLLEWASEFLKLELEEMVWWDYSVLAPMIDVYILCWRVLKEKHSNKAMITYQNKSKYLFNQYGCLMTPSLVSCVKITHLGSPRWMGTLRFLNPYCNFQRLQNSDLMLKFTYYTIQTFFHNLCTCLLC